MGIFIPILYLFDQLTCANCGRTLRGGVTRFDGGRKVGYLCRTCAKNSEHSAVSPWQPKAPVPPGSLRVNAWPVLAICLTAAGTVVVVFILSGLAWTALRTIHLLLSPHI
jgi:hypothetical protein